MKDFFVVTDHDLHKCLLAVLCHILTKDSTIDIPLLADLSNGISSKKKFWDILGDPSLW